MINYVPITSPAPIRRHFRDEQEMGPVLTVTNWKCRQTHRPSQRDGEEMPCVSIYKLNLQAAAAAPPDTAAWFAK